VLEPAQDLPGPGQLAHEQEHRDCLVQADDGEQDVLADAVVPLRPQLHPADRELVSAASTRLEVQPIEHGHTHPNS
jgi:hypothetical protein